MIDLETMQFTLPPTLEAAQPPEKRGLTRDGVRLMVARYGSEQVDHDVFHRLPEHLNPGDALIVNTSRTLPAAIDALTEDGAPVRLHLSSPLAGDLWAVEVRKPSGAGSLPGPQLEPQPLSLPAGGTARLLVRHSSPRLWVADIDLPFQLLAYLEEYGSPIRYGYSAGEWPLADYQTVYAGEPGSAEMPSAGRPFTGELLARLLARGVMVLPVVLHSGVASYEAGETPAEERYEVPATTARAINAVRSAGGRIVAVGTTVVRALETVADQDGTVHAGRGWTDLMVTPERGVKSIDGLLTGWHQPGASHLALIEAVASRLLVERCYREAVGAGYLWHEFGDSLLILST